MDRMETIISVSSLEKSFKGHKVLKGVDFKVNNGSIFALLGSNGAGKTTIVNILSTLLKPNGGNAKICGYDVVREGMNVRKHISLTGQYAAVDEALTGRENLQMIASLRHIPHGDKKAEELLSEYNLTDAGTRRVSTYSGGMRRRLDLAMSLLGEPAIIFLDEPTTGLDPQSRFVIWETVKSLADSGTTIFLTTQYLEEAEQIADYVAILNEGIIVAEGTPEKLKGKMPNGTVEISFNSENDIQTAYDLLSDYQISKNDEMLALNIITDGSVEQLSDILNHLNSSDVTVTGFSQKLPTLEDVFLTLINSNKKGVNL
ncbi:MAG: ATP-binding cassette domain-containing protein [Lachnospiraceae bacterium]